MGFLVGWNVYTESTLEAQFQMKTKDERFIAFTNDGQQQKRKRMK